MQIEALQTKGGPKRRLSDNISNDLRTVGVTIEDEQNQKKWAESVSASATSHSRESLVEEVLQPLFLFIIFFFLIIIIFKITS